VTRVDGLHVDVDLIHDVVVVDDDVAAAVDDKNWPKIQGEHSPWC
jgi:hypothetical protein